jgi:PEP-CTERM motif
LLGALVNQLGVLGQHYAPVIIGTELDAEAPSTLGFDVRLTTQDVILARTDLPSTQFSVSNPQAHQYATQLTTHSPVGPISLTRGWASVDATLDGTSFRFVTTHLDTGQALGPAIQFAQAQELLSSAGNTTLPVIYAGDFNSSADDPSDPTFPTYKSLIDAGLGDAWNAANPGDPGFTCCHGSPELLTANPMLTQRIDLTLFAGPFGINDAHLVGISGSDKVDGLWPSHHAGLVVTFDVPVPEPASMSLFVLGIGALAAARRRGPR